MNFIRSLPDDRFPYVGDDGSFRKRRDGSMALRWADYPLAECLMCAHMLSVRCDGCGHQVSLTCEDIAKRHSRWLHLPIRTWARGLRCSACDSKRIIVDPLNDFSSSTAFRNSHHDTAELIQARRLEWFMAVAERPIGDVAGLVSAYRPSSTFPA